MAPEKITDTGLGATAWASDSQNWNGRMAALVSSAIAMRQKPPTMTGSCPARPTASRTASKSSAPARA